MRVFPVLRGGVIALLGVLSACGGGGGDDGGNPNPAPPPMQVSLFVATQPANAAPQASFGTQPVVNVRLNGTLNAADNSTVVTASIVPGTGVAGATLVGSATATAVAGVATFTNLGVSTLGAGYQLRFSAP